jgi:Mrp family chromosome partitioning ATPase
MEGDWGEIDIMVVDLPPGTGDVQMTLIQKWKPAGAVIVSTPQDLALIDATRAIDLFRKMEVPIFGLVENMAGYQCPSCGEMSDPFGTGGAEAAARVMDIRSWAASPSPCTFARRAMPGIRRPPAKGYESTIFRDIARRLFGADKGLVSSFRRTPSFSARCQAGVVASSPAGKPLVSRLRGKEETLMPLSRDEDIAETLLARRAPSP